jgi:hypothetical protein
MLMISWPIATGHPNWRFVRPNRVRYSHYSHLGRVHSIAGFVSAPINRIDVLAIIASKRNGRRHQQLSEFGAPHCWANLSPLLLMIGHCRQMVANMKKMDFATSASRHGTALTKV